jgi:hypothetical protein
MLMRACSPRRRFSSQAGSNCRSEAWEWPVRSLPPGRPLWGGGAVAVVGSLAVDMAIFGVYGHAKNERNANLSLRGYVHEM